MCLSLCVPSQEGLNLQLRQSSSERGDFRGSRPRLQLRCSLPSSMNHFGLVEGAYSSILKTGTVPNKQSSGLGAPGCCWGPRPRTHRTWAGETKSSLSAPPLPGSGHTRGPVVPRPRKGTGSRTLAGGDGSRPARRPRSRRRYGSSEGSRRRLRRRAPRGRGHGAALRGRGLFGSRRPPSRGLGCGSCSGLGRRRGGDGQRAGKGRRRPPPPSSSAASEPLGLARAAAPGLARPARPSGSATGGRGPGAGPAQPRLRRRCPAAPRGRTPWPRRPPPAPACFSALPVPVSLCRLRPQVPWLRPDPSAPGAPEFASPPPVGRLLGSGKRGALGGRGARLFDPGRGGASGAAESLFCDTRCPRPMLSSQTFAPFDYQTV